jgi:4-hydroxybenzoate polyprenyltransferase
MHGPREAFKLQEAPNLHEAPNLQEAPNPREAAIPREATKNCHGAPRHRNLSAISIPNRQTVSRMIARVQGIAQKAIAALELSRLPLAFGTVSSVWVMVFVARAEPALAELPAARLALWQTLPAATMFAAGFLAFGAALNDFLDAKHDREFAPDRPIPSGLVRPRRAMQFAAVSLLVGIAGALPFGEGALLAALSLAAIVLLYDACAKHVPAFGFVLVGLATAASMLVPAPGTALTLPSWLAMSQTMGVGALAYVVGEKRPRLTRRAILLGAWGWLFWTAAILALGVLRSDGELLPAWFAPSRLVVPFGVAVVGALLLLRKLAGPRTAARGEQILRTGSLWKSLVAAGWIYALGEPTAAFAIAGLATVIFLVFALLREAGPQVAEPATWRG